jgi:Tol biopolymer transport system component
MSLSVASVAGAQVPPDEKYLQFETDHFRVIFPEGMEPFARRASVSAEWAYAALSEHFIEPPKGRIALVITDFTDRPNASATPIPDNRVVLIAAPQLTVRQLNYYTDWLNNALVHELTHIFHLDRADGIWGVAQFVFGRVPAFFPGFYQPQWVIEGLPSYYESRLTGAGRAYGSTFDMLLSNDAEDNAFRTVDAADGLAPIFPSGTTPYAYGGMYFRDVAEQNGDSTLAELARKGSRRLPYTLNWASSPLYGQTLTGSWEDWSERFAAYSTAFADSVRAGGWIVGEPLSEFAWNVSTPRYSRDGKRLAFTYITPRDDPATVVIDPATGVDVVRTRRNGSGGNAWAADGSVVYLSQVEFADRYDIYSDLYTVDARSGKERRLTKGARYASPDMSPDGVSLVAIETGRGTNRLVEIDPATLEAQPITEFEYGVNWDHPRWSPNGRYIAAERWMQGEVLDIVVVDRSGRLVQRITEDEAADVAPAWSADGRYLLWASDRNGPYDIYATLSPEAGVDDGKVWRVTRTASGASDPDMSPDGRWIAYAANYHRGVRIERIPFDTTTWELADPGWRELREPPVPPSDNGVSSASDVRSYNPFPSLWPKAWLPVFTLNSDELAGDFIGVLVAGTDDIRRHRYGILAGWRTGVEKPEARVTYSYAGFGNPVLGISVSQEWDEVLRSTSTGTVFTTVERERDLVLSANFLRPRIQNALSVVPGVGVQHVKLEPTGGVQLVDSTFTDLEALLLIGFTRARGYPRSVSAEKGWRASLLLSHQRLADDFGRWEVAAEGLASGYLSFPVFGFANHVIAGRLSFGASYAEDRGPDIFELGGIPGRAIDFGFGFNYGAGDFYPVRGYSEGVQFGDRIVATSLEYRLPLILVGRGYGLWPLFLDRLSASVFVDAGSAWFDTDDIEVIASAGTELSVDLGANYSAVYRFRLGFAVPFDRTLGDPTVYLATGIAF